MIALLMLLAGLVHFFIYFVPYAAAGQVGTSQMAEIAGYTLIAPAISALIIYLIPVRNQVARFFVAIATFVAVLYVTMFVWAYATEAGGYAISALETTLFFSPTTLLAFVALSAVVAVYRLAVKRKATEPAVA